MAIYLKRRWLAAIMQFYIKLSVALLCTYCIDMQTLNKKNFIFVGKLLLLSKAFYHSKWFCGP